MKFTIPQDTDLSERVKSNANLFPTENGHPSITDAQYLALQAGVGRSESLLVSAPTSTGKTLVGWWAAASALEAGKRVVYLVSHRALAAQKFVEIQTLFVSNWLDNDFSSIACATGDGILDGSGRSSSAPLSATFLVATYEKYLSLISAGGPPQDLTDVVFICDEVQLIGDGSRGKHVELLLSILKKSGWHQFVGLSAVMDEAGATQFSEWLNLTLVRTTSREKSIRMEVRGSGTYLESLSSPSGNSPVSKIVAQRPRQLNGMIDELVNKEKVGPTIVFCMKVDDTYQLCSQWAQTLQVSQNIQVPAGVDIDLVLLAYINKRCAFHNAELSDEERNFVEHLIAEGKIDVIFATSTLAAGVNFPLGSAVFSKWKRWNFEKKIHEPIRRDEFQNMAGRVGRMGQVAAEGKVLATADSPAEMAQIEKLIDFSKQATLGVGIAPQDFSSLIIQLFAGGMCDTKDAAFELLASTLSALREAERGRGDVEHWRPHLEAQVNRLIATHCLLPVGQRLSVTPFGKAVAHSGLKPETAEFFLDYLCRRSEEISPFLPTPQSNGRDDDLLFIFIHGSLVCPEFDKTGGASTRNLHWRLGQNGQPINNPNAQRLNHYLFERPWVANPHAANGVVALANWATGKKRSDLEGTLDGVRLGIIQTTARDVAWLLYAVSEVITSASSPTLAIDARHPLLQSDETQFGRVRQFSRVLRRYSSRVAAGLPSDCLWLTNLDLTSSPSRLSRQQIVSLYEHGIAKPHLLMDGSREFDDLRKAALPSQNGVYFPNLVRNAAKDWKLKERNYFREKHLRKAARHNCVDLVKSVYESTGIGLENVIKSLLTEIGIKCEVLDDGKHPAWPDLKFCFEAIGVGPDIVVEVKSKDSASSLVPLNDAIEVLSASELVGLGNNPCLTICSPGVEPSVQTSISGCKRLCVLEVADLIEAFLRIKDGNLPLSDFYNWLVMPGVALRDDLPFVTGQLV